MLDVFSRKPHLIVHSTAPLNAEPPPDRLRAAFITAVPDFYVRTHGDIPSLDAATHMVRVTGRVRTPLDLSVAALETEFEPQTVMAVLQCAGNRRADLQRVKATSGDPWGPGAIGNALWTGVPLSALLRRAGVEEDASLHVALDAVDIADNEGAEPAPYGASIPLPKALSGDVLLAYAMNGEPLTAEHGAPVRVVVPGYAGVRSVKWVKEIRVQEAPSTAFQQRHDYLLFPPDMTKATEDVARGAPIFPMPLNAAICVPQPGATLAAGFNDVRGYAIASDRVIIRVDLSIDGGRHWHQATVEDHGNERWSWTFWSARLDLPAGAHELVVRAWDAAGQTQPADLADVWNFKGYLCAAWHRVTVTVA